MKRNMIILVTFILVVLVPTPHLQGQIYDLFNPHLKVNERGDTLRYRMMEPELQDDDQRYPVILFLHGAGERGRDNTHQLFHVVHRFASVSARAKYPCYVLAPQCPPGQWWSAISPVAGNATDATRSGSSVLQQMIMDVIDEIVREQRGDPARIYVTGLSMGGAGTWDMLHYFPGRFAAAIPICGWTDISRAPGMTDLPIWVFHGADDNVIDAAHSRRMVDALRKGGSSVIYTEFEGVRHDSWEYVFTDDPLIYDWLFSKRRGGD